MEAIASRLEANSRRLEASAIRLEASLVGWRPSLDRAITCALGIYFTCALDITCALGINQLCTDLLPSSGVGPTPHETNEWVGVGGGGVGWDGVGGVAVANHTV